MPLLNAFKAVSSRDSWGRSMAATTWDCWVTGEAAACLHVWALRTATKKDTTTGARYVKSQL